MSDKRKNRTFVFDLILVLALLAIGLSALLIFNLVRDAGSYVRVKVGEDVVLERPLDINAEYSINGGSNILQIKEGRVSMTYADCPDKVCVNTGSIYLELDTIVCLPNKVFVEVVNK